MPDVEMESQPSGPLVEYARGDNLDTIADRHGISRATAHRIIVKDGAERIEALERDLLLAQLMEENGRPDLAQWPGIVIPPQSGPDRADAIDLFHWCRKRLRQRGWRLETTTRYVPVVGDAGEAAGHAVVFFLTAIPEEDQQ